MAWRRHNRNLTHEVFYDGTTIDGSRLEKALRVIKDKFNKVPKGDVENRFVAVQYHAGFSPQLHSATAAHNFPWLKIDNRDVYGVQPPGAPHNVLRLKGTRVPGIYLNAGYGSGTGIQYAWSRTFAFKKPVVVDSISILLQVEPNGPFQGDSASAGPYEYTNPPPPGYANADLTADVIVLMDVFNPTTPEDAVMTNVEYVRRRWVVERELFTLFASGATGTGWDDMFPTFDSGDVSNVRPLDGRLMEDRDLNIPIHAGAKVRLSIVIPEYDGTVVGRGSWGTVPWYLQAWSTTLTVLEELQAL